MTIVRADSKGGFGEVLNWMGIFWGVSVWRCGPIAAQTCRVYRAGGVRRSISTAMMVSRLRIHWMKRSRALITIQPLQQAPRSTSHKVLWLLVEGNHLRHLLCRDLCRGLC